MKSNPIFQDAIVPEGASLAGYSHLVRTHGIPSHVRFPSCVSKGHVRGNITQAGVWRLYDKRYWPGDNDTDHLVFALKHENFDLLSLKRILDVLPRKEIENHILSSATGIYSRKIWFLYEWLKDIELSIPDCPKCQTIFLLDPENYFTSHGIYSKRHRMKNNLLGSRLFSPIIRKTALLQDFLQSGLKDKTDAVVGKVSRSLIARAASFMLLADSKASFAIEGEKAPSSRIERWGKAVLQAGRFPISKDEIIRLQKIVIKDTRFTRMGFREDGVFLGERDADGSPLPEFIGARPDDLEMLIDAVIEADKAMTAEGLDPVLHAASLSFGFVYIHPLEDGNGRLHRYLIHHVLAQNNFSPAGLIFPISSSMLKSVERYRDILRNHALPLMDLIEWEPTENMNVNVLNATRDLYSYFDCTEACEYLYACVRETIEKDLPEELLYLKSHDKAMGFINNIVDIPDNEVKKLIIFVRQNNGILPRKRREKEFMKLTDDEVRRIESAIEKAFSSQQNPF